MIQTIRDWLDHPIVLSKVLPLAVMGGLLLLALVGLAGANLSARKATEAPDPARPEGFLARWFRTMRLAPGENLVIRSIFAAFAVLFLMAIATAFVLVGGVLWQAVTAPGDATPSASLGLGALLVALLGAPFLIWRTLVAQRTLEATHRQTDLQDEALFNDKINAAATDLATRRQMTRVVGHGRDQRVLTEWRDDLVTRAAAIDRLEGLARERPDTTGRIAKLLSIYLRELSSEHPPEGPPAKISGVGLFGWAHGLRPARSDMEKAAQTLGRLQAIDNHTIKRGDLDLSGVNLQGFNLEDSVFDQAILRRARLDGAFLNRATFNEANLLDAGMIGVKAKSAQFQRTGLGADLSWSLLDGAIFEFIDSDEGSLTGTNGRYAIFQEAQLLNATFHFTSTTNKQRIWAIAADFSNALMRGCLLEGFDPRHEQRWPAVFNLTRHEIGLAFRNCMLTQALVARCDLDGCFGDGSVTLPDGAGPESDDWPNHWSKEKLSDADYAFRLEAWRR